jgi:hypothetical protein
MSTENVCKHPDGVAGAHGLPGTRNAADHYTKQRFEAALGYFEGDLDKLCDYMGIGLKDLAPAHRFYCGVQDVMASEDVDQSTAINILLDRAKRAVMLEPLLKKPDSTLQAATKAIKEIFGI